MKKKTSKKSGSKKKSRKSKPKPKLKLIIFDLGGVVAHGGFLPFVNKFCETCLAPEGMKAVKALERQFNRGDITDRQFYSRLRKTFGVHLTSKQMHDAIYSKMKTDKELIKFIPKLKKSKLAIFTNSLGHITQEVLYKNGIPTRKLFDKVFVSARLHMVKPDKHTYRYILKKMKVKPEEALMVDDRLVNIKGARAVGMQGIVYKNATQFKKALRKFDLTG